MNFTKTAKILLVGSFLSFLIGFILVSYPVAALAWNLAFPKTSAELSKILSETIKNGEEQNLETEITENKPQLILPDKDESLTKTPTLIIPKLGINTAIIEETQENYETALMQGVWRVPNYGVPVEQGPPIILVAHRFGYLNWSQSYREQNSFFNLPKLEVGDKVEIIWDQRKFVYEIYDAEDGEQISDYTANLILYTCRFIESDIRIFRYAKRIQ